MHDVLTFIDRPAFRDWLKLNCNRKEGIWIQFSKVPNPSNELKPTEALEEALCFGWIDGKIRKIDEKDYVKYFTKRSVTSKWSNLNKRIVARLINEKKMELPGLNAIEVSKRNGCWDNPNNIRDRKEDIEPFKEILKGDRELFMKYINLAPSLQRGYANFYFEAKKEETRKARLVKIKMAIKGKLKGILY